MKILICDPDETRLTHLVSSFPDYDIVSTVSGKECLNTEPVEVAFISQEVSDIVWDNLVEVLSQQGIPVYLMGETNLDLLQTLLQLGGKGIVAPDPDEIAKVFKRLDISAGQVKPNDQAVAVKKNRPLRGRLERTTKALPETKRKVQPEQPAILYNRNNLDTKIPHSKLVVFYAFKGGVGKSVLSASTAVALANNRFKKLNVCVVDFDPYNGDLAKILNINYKCSILDWLVKDGEDLKDYLVDHPSGVKILPGPCNPLDGLAIGKEEAKRILSVLTRRFDVVVVDTSPIPRDSIIVAIENATHVFMIGTPNRITLVDNNNIGKTFQKAQINTTEFNLVINMMKKKAPLRLTDYTDVLPWEIKMVIPDDPAVDRVINSGGLPVLDRRSKTFNQSIMEIANMIEPVFVEQKRFTWPKIPKIFFRKAVN